MSLRRKCVVHFSMAAVIIGCARPDPRVGAVSESASARGNDSVTERVGRSRDVRSPIRVSLEGPPQVVANQTLHLRAVVERYIGMTVPMTVVLRLPPGARLIRGEATRQLPPNTTARTDVLEYDIAIGEVPAEDVWLVTDVRGEGIGFHGRVAYRFGRPEPLPARPPLAQESVRVGGRDFGRPVQLQ